MYGMHVLLKCCYITTDVDHVAICRTFLVRIRIYVCGHVIKCVGEKAAVLLPVLWCRTPCATLYLTSVQPGATAKSYPVFVTAEVVSALHDFISCHTYFTTLLWMFSTLEGTWMARIWPGRTAVCRTCTLGAILRSAAWSEAESCCHTCSAMQLARVYGDSCIGVHSGAWKHCRLVVLCLLQHFSKHHVVLL
jgi:hypothetical protein